MRIAGGHALLKKMSGGWPVDQAAEILATVPGLAPTPQRLTGIMRNRGWYKHSGGQLAITPAGEQFLAEPDLHVTGAGLIELHRILGGRQEIQVMRLEMVA